MCAKLNEKYWLLVMKSNSAIHIVDPELIKTVACQYINVEHITSMIK